MTTLRIATRAEAANIHGTARTVVQPPADINVDPYAGVIITDPPIYPLTGEESVVDQLDSGSRIDAGRDGVITFSFYNAQHANGWLAAGHYPGYIRDEDGNFVTLRGGPGMGPMTPEQQDAARAAIQLWDDLVEVEFREVNGHGGGSADIVFANSADPAQAFAYHGGSFRGGWDSYLGDVFIADPDLNSSNSELDFGQYGRTTLVHEIGHSLGLTHPGDYNFSNDRDDDGEPDPISYDTDAEYFQDSHQYTIMSYFGAWNTGAAPVDWLYSGGVLYDGSPQGPMLHDIFVIQQAYGADPNTRAGETVYGFNSNAGNPMFDFDENPLPYYALYDAGGDDTIDLSGFQSSQYLNLNEGAFSSIGDVPLSQEEFGAAFRDGYLAAYGVDLYEYDYTDDELGAIAEGGLQDTQNFIAGLIEDDTGVAGIGAVNYETFAIAYGTEIENAVGGQGRDLIVGNGLANTIDGQGGNDVLVGGGGDDTLIGGLGNDVLYGQSGADTFAFANDGSLDTIADFQTGADRIDLSAIEGATAETVTYDAASRRVLVDTDGDGAADMYISVNGTGVDIGDYIFG